MAILQAFLAIETWGHPHVNPILNGMEDLALTLDVFQLFLGLGLFFVTDIGHNMLAELFSVLILVSNVVFFIYWFRTWFKHSDYREKVVVLAKKASKTLSLATSHSVHSVRSSRGMSMNFIRKKQKDGSIKMNSTHSPRMSTLDNEYYSRAKDLLNTNGGEERRNSIHWIKLIDQDGKNYWFNGDTGEETYTSPMGDEKKKRPEKIRRKSCRIPKAVVEKENEDREDVPTFEQENIFVTQHPESAVDDDDAEDGEDGEEGEGEGEANDGSLFSQLKKIRDGGGSGAIEMTETVVKKMQEMENGGGGGGGGGEGGSSGGGGGGGGGGRVRRGTRRGGRGKTLGVNKNWQKVKTGIKKLSKAEVAERKTRVEVFSM